MTHSIRNQQIFNNPIAQDIYEKISNRMDDEDFSLPEIIDPLIDKEIEVKEPVEATVTEISIEGIRSFGPPQSIKTSQDITLIYAPNGTGKTSLIDALELLKNGETSRARSIQTQSEAKDDTHIPHRLRNGLPSPTHKPTVKISWINNQDNMQTAVWENNFGAGTENIPNFELIARRQLRSLVNSKPAERLSILASALNLEQMEHEWTEIAKAFTNNPIKVESTGTVPHTVARDLIEKSGLSDFSAKSIRKWAEDQVVPDEKLSLPSEVPNNLQDSFSEEFKQLINLRKQKNDTDKPLESAINDIYLKIIDLIEDKDQQCPVCMDGELTSIRLAEIRQELENSSNITKINSNIDKYEKQIRNRLKNINIPTWNFSDKYYQNKIFSEAEIKKLEEDLKSQELKLTQSIEEFSNELSDSNYEMLYGDFTEYNNLLDIIRPKILEYINQIQVEANNIDPYDKSMIDSCKSNPKYISEIINEIIVTNKINYLLNDAKIHIKNKIQKKTEKQILDFAENINGWLDLLAPENTPPIKIKPVGNNTAKPSLQILIDSENSTKAPHAIGHLSDAQLDMFCLATHLARIERECPGAMIILDDPSDMLDSVATQKFVEQGLHKILESSHKSQIILLTHDDSLVKDIWDYCSKNNVDLIQYNFELNLIDENDLYSDIAPRNLEGALKRIDALGEYNQQDTYRIWYRAAYASHTRIALEMYAKDIAEIFGPKCLGILPAHSVSKKDKKGKEIFIRWFYESALEQASSPIRNKINDILCTSCKSKRHKLAINYCEDIRDVLSGTAGSYLNPGSHAEVIIPEVYLCKKYVKDLKKSYKSLIPESSNPEERLTSTPLARELRKLIDCDGNH